MPLLKLITFITTLLLIPSFAIVISLNSQFIAFEYARESFPPDPLGMDQTTRYQLATQSLSFLTSWQRPHRSVYILQQLFYPDSIDPAYTHDEISHLLDVKAYTDRIRLIFIISFTLGFIILANTHNQPKKLYPILKASRAAALTLIGLIILLGVAIAFYWQWFFIQFHQLLFPQGNWTFSPYSTLIRLFPELFWVDYAVLATSLILTISLLTILLISLTISRQKKTLT